jgi:serine/threonine-protein kinase RsbW
VQVMLLLNLPRDAAGVPVVRRLLGNALRTLGVSKDCVADIEVAVSEACSNVLRHTGDEDDFEVSAAIDEHWCVLEVIDRGAGFNAGSVPEAVGHEAESGRGVRLMRALLDAIDFENHPRGGTVARLRKQLVWDPPALFGRAPAGRPSPMSGY